MIGTNLLLLWLYDVATALPELLPRNAFTSRADRIGSAGMINIPAKIRDMATGKTSASISDHTPG